MGTPGEVDVVYLWFVDAFYAEIFISSIKPRFLVQDVFRFLQTLTARTSEGSLDGASLARDDSGWLGWLN